MSRDHAIAHEVTKHILQPLPAPGLRSPLAGAPGNLNRLPPGCAGGTESRLCPQLAQEEVFPARVFSGQARIKSGMLSTSTILPKQINEYNIHNTYIVI